ncbi:outer membrane beta-barrel protein [Helicobacter cetorum]|uniref:outer membrane beta-barrel protein n=1 Tax=Helicobacter cetorum TaxID=138563 RepID=UPI000CF0DA3F|nr:outer membrane beta-barrel protein [Helicobacter cetorum]
MRVKKVLLYLSLVHFGFTEENGAYASVGFQYSLMHAVQQNDPFLNQERIKTIINAQNNIAQLKKVENQVKGMSKNFAYINNQLKQAQEQAQKEEKIKKLDPSFEPSPEQIKQEEKQKQEGMQYIQSVVKGIGEIVTISHSASSTLGLDKALENMQNPKNLTSPQTFEENLGNLEKQFTQSQGTILSNLSSQIAEISNSINAMPKGPSSATNSNMFGVSLNVGYKHFFGKEKRHGFRYYLFYEYGYSNPNYRGNGTTILGKMNNHVYGIGADYLFNFIDNEKTHFTTGIYMGFALAGSSWVAEGMSMWISQMNFINNYLPNYSATMHTSYFQIPLKWGFRTNIDRHNGFEIGMQIPLAVNSYYESHGKGLNSALYFKRSIVFSANYVYNF